VKLTFYGGAGVVTGALYLLEDKDVRILVECGMQQGGRFCEKNNYKPFPFDVSTIDAVFITHAHLDHTGRVPKLIKEGYTGPIYSTGPTKDAAYELLLDAHGLMKHEHPNEMLYDITDIDKAIAQWKSVHYRKPFSLKHLTIEFRSAGHILGSASIKINSSETSVVFSGDLGNIPAPLISTTDYFTDADYALVESAYGNRVHEPAEERSTILEDIIEDTAKTGGTLMIPSFAMERTQDLLYELDKLVEGHRIPELPVFIDSPLAIKLTYIYKKYFRDPEFFNDEVLKDIKEGDEIFNFPRLQFTLTSEQSKHINNVPPPKVVVAGSGMSTGGRILFHEMRYLPDPNSTLFIVGFQPEGSLGRKMLEGKKQVTIMHEKIPVRARVAAFGGYSAHADRPLLLKWVGEMKKSLKKVFVVQGELDQSIPLAKSIRDEFAIDGQVPEQGMSVELT